MYYSVFVATYTFKIKNKRANGVNHIQALLDYLKARTEELYFLEQPAPLMGDLCPTLEHYRFGKLISVKKMPGIFKIFWTVSKKRKAKGGTVFWLKIRDFLSVFYFTLFLDFLDVRRPKFPKDTLFIGVESINSLAGLILKKLGKIKTSVYYIVDFGPTRYGSDFLNKIYIWLDKISTYQSDFVWYSSVGYPKLKKEKLGYPAEKMKPWSVIPFAVNNKGIKILPEEKLNHRIIFNGSVEEENGVNLIVEAFAEVLKYKPDLRLKIIGGGPLEERIREKIAVLGIGANVEITGYFFDVEKIREDFCSSKIGLAPYCSTKASMKAYGDPIKLKEYMACGLPVITTSIPLLAKYIAEKPAGIIINRNSKELAHAILKLLDDKNFYRLCRRNALEFGKNNTWENNFEKAFEKMNVGR